MDGLGENGWRWVICTSAVPAAITQIIRFGLPESPQWLVAVGKQDRAQEIISRFMGERYLVPQEQEKVESASWFSLFSARQWRKDCCFLRGLVLSDTSVLCHQYLHSPRA